MNKIQHIIIGIIAFLIYTFFFNSIIKILTDVEFYGFGCGFGCVIIGSILPDILEPAYNWKHRGIYHSKRALKFSLTIFVITALISLISIFFRDFLVFYVISCLFLGYLVHLVADSTTYVGLPDNEGSLIKKGVYQNPSRVIYSKDEVVDDDDDYDDYDDDDY
jgi:membrane-bound metal-dependent hydrolase YbcI (DUF457 family)